MDDAVIVGCKVDEEDEFDKVEAKLAMSCATGPTEAGPAARVRYWWVQLTVTARDFGAHY